MDCFTNNFKHKLDDIINILNLISDCVPFIQKS